MSEAVPERKKKEGMAYAIEELQKIVEGETINLLDVAERRIVRSEERKHDVPRPMRTPTQGLMLENNEFFKRLLKENVLGTKDVEKMMIKVGAHLVDLDLIVYSTASTPAERSIDVKFLGYTVDMPLLSFLSDPTIFTQDLPNIFRKYSEEEPYVKLTQGPRDGVVRVAEITVGAPSRAPRAISYHLSYDTIVPRGPTYIPPDLRVVVSQKTPGTLAGTGNCIDEIIEYLKRK